MSLPIYQIKMCYISNYNNTERYFCTHQYLRRDSEQLGQSLWYFLWKQWHCKNFLPNTWLFPCPYLYSYFAHLIILRCINSSHENIVKQNYSSSLFSTLDTPLMWQSHYWNIFAHFQTNKRDSNFWFSIAQQPPVGQCFHSTTDTSRPVFP